MDWKEELQEAKDLYECGIISKEDFEELKAECLRKRDTLISYGLAEDDTGDSDLLELVRIEAGSFMMGLVPNGKDPLGWATHRHEVEISQDFYIGKYQVTEGLWKEIMGKNSGKSMGENHPVRNVKWLEVVAFCNKLSEREGKEPVYTINGDNVSCNWDAKGYRLPTETEWEYVARGGEEQVYSGSDKPNDVAWHSGNSGGKTHPVGQKQPNAWGLYDMSGNVCEWCWDWLDDNEYQRRGAGAVDPRGPSKATKSGNCANTRVFRGGGYSEQLTNQQCSYRNGLSPKYGLDYLGFRIMIPT